MLLIASHFTQELGSFSVENYEKHTNLGTQKRQLKLIIFFPHEAFFLSELNISIHQCIKIVQKIIQAKSQRKERALFSI